MSSVSSAVAGQATTDPRFSLPSDIPPAFAKYQEEVRESILAAITPLNITIVLILFTLLYYRLKSNDTTPTLPAQKSVVFRTFTPRTLLPFNGTPSKPHNPDGKVFLAVKGKVYDVTSGRNFYGPGGPYENFAGRDATRGLACQSFDEEMLTKNLDGPLDDCKDLGAEEMDNLRGWVERFEEKYLVVGKLVAFGNLNSPFN